MIARNGTTGDNKKAQNLVPPYTAAERHVLDLMYPLATTPPAPVNNRIHRARRHLPSALLIPTAICSVPVPTAVAVVVAILATGGFRTCWSSVGALYIADATSRAFFNIISLIYYLNKESSNKLKFNRIKRFKKS